MLPLPHIKFVPKLLAESNDDSGIALTDKLDEIVIQAQQETIALKYLMDPLKCPAQFLKEFGYNLGAIIADSDDDRTKRKKVRDAVKDGKLRGSWNLDAKPLMDTITQYNSKLLTSPGLNDWIIGGSGFIPSAYFWGTIGGSASDDEFGLGLFGQGDELGTPGNIYIDLHDGVDTAVLSQAIIDNIILNIEDSIVPAYMRTVLGYIDSSGEFQEYGRIE